MFIYKVTNDINNKIYIGQTIHPIEQRWKKHVYDAKHGKDTHFARAIRKYGEQHFYIEQIDIATSKEELDEKECYWINFYNSIHTGYNSCDGGGDANTYKYKTKQEMDEIKEKIKDTKIGELNPKSEKVKCFNINTKQEYHFTNLEDMQKFFGESQHNFITRRCQGKTKCLYKKEWNIAYENNEYFKLTTYKHNRKSKKIEVEKLDTGEKKNFESYASAERYFNLPLKTFSRKAYLHGSEFIIKDIYKINVLE